MTNLALNAHMSAVLKPKYTFLLGFLPMGLMFASFLPLWIFAKWFAGYLGIPLDGPAQSENGIVWLVVFLLLMLIAMFAGYVLGWLLNGLISKFIYGWSKDKIQAVYLQSQVPEHWLKQKQPLSAAMHEKMQKWQDTKQHGQWRYILKTGVLSWGLFMFVVMALVPAISSESPIDYASLLFQAGIWSIAGLAFGFITWLMQDLQYKKYEDEHK